MRKPPGGQAASAGAGFINATKFIGRLGSGGKGRPFDMANLRLPR